MSESGDAGRPDESDLPGTIAPGSVLLVTGPAPPSEDGLDLQVLRRYAGLEDAGIVVTTASGVDATVAAYSALAGDDSSAQLGVVDTVSRGQNLTAFHRDVPAIFTPGPADLARVSVAIDNLDAQLSTTGVSHLVVRSVASFFEKEDASTVVRGFERTFGNWSENGLVVLGVDFTAVDESTMDALTDLADGIVRLAPSESGQFRLEYQGTTPRHPAALSDTSCRGERE